MHKIAIIVLSISINMCFGCSKEPFHRDGSFEYPEHMFWLRNKKKNFQLSTLIWGPGKGSKILKAFLLLYSIKMLVMGAGIHHMLARIANRKDTDQTAVSEAV